MGRAPCCEKVGLKKGRWTAEEDEILMKFIAAHGEGSWRSLPKNAGLLRCGKSCRLRWINYLRADLKRGNISQQEEETIIKLQASLGNRWSVIAGHLPGRTDNEIKNYWNSHLSRKLHSFGQTGDGDGDGEPVAVDLSKVASKRKGGRPAGKSEKKKQTNNESMRSEENEKGAQSEEGESITSSVTFGLQTEVLGSNEELDCGLLRPSLVVESEYLGAGEDSGVMSSSESGAHVVSEEGDQGGVKVGLELDGVEKWVDWEEGLWNGVGEMWPWGWDGGISEVLEVQGMDGDVYPYQLEGSSLDSYWL